MWQRLRCSRVSLSKYMGDWIVTDLNVVPMDRVRGCSGGLGFTAEGGDSADFSPELCLLVGVLVATDTVELLLCVLVASGVVWLGVSVATDTVELLLWAPAVIFALWLSKSVADVATRRLARALRCDRP